MNHRLRALPILVLSLGLQLLPLCRQLFVAPSAFGSPLAIIFRWAAGAVALLGANHAVSGATNTAINSSPTAAATIGRKFNYRITTTGYEAFSWSASGLPTNIALVIDRLTNTTANVSTPVGTYPVTLIAYEGLDQSGGQTAPFVLTLSVGNSPTITTNPANLSAIQGTNVNFSVAVGGTGPFSYQWMKDGAVMDGATAPNLSLVDVQPIDAATYTVKVTSPFGNVTSLSTRGILTVLVPPNIDLDPFDVVAAPGDAATFSVAASGAGPLKYQWRFKGNGLSGATNSLLTIKNVTTNNAGAYACVVTNSAGSVTSAPAVLTILGVPTISSQPQSFTATEGDPTALSVTAGPQPLTYQWYFNSTLLPLETDSSIFLNPLGTNQAGPYFVVVSNVYGSVTSAVATVTVLAPPRIVSPPSNVAGVAGGSAVFNVSASGTAPLEYQWLFNGSNLSGATGSSLNLSNLLIGQAGTYSVIVTNVVGSVTSAPATLSFSAAPPGITSQPRSLSIVLGGSTNLSVQGSGGGPLSYQWLFKGTNLSGQNAMVLPLNSISLSNAGDYTLILSNSAGSVTSEVATVTVLVPPAVAMAPQPKTVWSGGAASFSVTATGTDPLRYQWRFQGGDLSGKTQDTLALSSLNSNNAGVYQVVITNIAGSVTSAPVALTVLERSTLKVVGQSLSAVQVGFTIQPGVSYELLCFNSLSDTNLIPLSNWPAQVATSNAIYADPLTNGPGRFYQLRMTIP